jgi:hypothetical protein
MDCHLQKAVAGSSEMLVTSYHTKWTQTPQYCDLHRTSYLTLISKLSKFKTEEGVSEDQEHLKSHTLTLICVPHMLSGLSN